ncbi:glycosyltransferase family 1 protein [Pseudarthrobacter phenanthrenivorans]|uniref:glycosyltransferase n=1 Tax=Pseudarthrobacter phenanthrenivorans TaxID=361575 RepID=UPI0011264334|nr:glycosyltransferase [Pseudarthrobacter phenanthrenivorans]TPV49404.1 glycosyltransferase family 1 protein [Pseudarthrobacter phenanthrenivorans]
MRIMLLTAGTRGDVEPFFALARAAAARGHVVRTAIPDNSGADTTALDTVSLRMDFAQLVTDQGVSPVAAAKAFRTVIRPSVGRLLAAAVEHIIAFNPDVVVYHPKILSAPGAAERLGVPSVLVETIPSLTATREFPAPFITRANLGPLNRASYSLAKVATLMFRQELARALEGLPPAPGPVPVRRATMIPVSPELLPRPADWPATVHLTGHWSEEPKERDWDKELAEFVADGGFVYAGFGSMKAGDPRARGEAIMAAARKNGLRTLVASGWGGIDIPPEVRGDDVLVRESVNHQLVLPHAAAAVHHGGAGTVHAVAHAGIPSVVVPFIADQPFWGHRLHQRGIAPEPIPYLKVTAERLTDALAGARNCREQAAEVGERIRKEDGTAVALDVLETFAAS